MEYCGEQEAHVRKYGIFLFGEGMSSSDLLKGKSDIGVEQDSDFAVVIVCLFICFKYDLRSI